MTLPGRDCDEGYCGTSFRGAERLAPGSEPDGRRRESNSDRWHEPGRLGDAVLVDGADQPNPGRRGANGGIRAGDRLRVDGGIRADGGIRTGGRHRRRASRRTYRYPRRSWWRSPRGSSAPPVRRTPPHRRWRCPWWSPTSSGMTPTGYVARPLRRRGAYRDDRPVRRSRPATPRPGHLGRRRSDGFGQLAARLAVTEARQLAGEYGVGVVTIRNCNHIGRLGEYVQLLAEADAVGLAFCNINSTVAPYGGRERRLGTNPLAWSVPRSAGNPPIVVDFATSATAEGKLALSLARQERVGAGLLVDADGRDSTDPGDFYTGGALLPFGQHKGYGLSVMIEIVGGLLSGAGVSSLPGYDNTNGTVLIAIDIGTFLPVSRFRTESEAFCRLLGDTAPAVGTTARVRTASVPGEKEARTRRMRIRDGIPLAPSTWRELAGLPGGPTLPGLTGTPGSPPPPRPTRTHVPAHLRTRARIRHPRCPHRRPGPHPRLRPRPQPRPRPKPRRRRDAPARGGP